MEIRLIAIGRIKGAESELAHDYLDRAGKMGRPHGLGKVRVLELDERKLRDQKSQLEALDAAIGQERFWLLDERGMIMSSPEFASKIGAVRDQGLSRLNFVIGGADGVDANFRKKAELLLSFGQMVWPHMLARVMLAEQIYRATTIWSSSPYHRA